MTTDQYDVLLEKAYRAATGRGPGLSAADLQAVVAELQEPGDPRRRPILLKILGAPATSHTDRLLSRF